MTLHVRAVPWRKGWELHIENMGVTQVTRLEKAEAQVRDYLESLTGAPAGDESIVIVPDLGELGRQIEGSRRRTAAAVSEQRAAAQEARATVRALLTSGVRPADIAYLLGISRARVTQLSRG